MSITVIKFSEILSPFPERTRGEAWQVEADWIDPGLALIIIDHMTYRVLINCHTPEYY